MIKKECKGRILENFIEPWEQVLESHQQKYLMDFSHDCCQVTLVVISS